MTVAAAEPAGVCDRMPAHGDALVQTNRRGASARLLRGPLLAVCGLAGGVGATTLSYLVALAAARSWAGSVLLADTGGPSAGLAACAGVEVARSLSELAAQLAAGAPLAGGIYATSRDGVRILAAGPEFSSHPTGEAIRRLVGDAREVHALTVIDCGTLAGAVEQVITAEATHVAWMLAATRQGMERGRRVLEAAPPQAGAELIVARNDVRYTRASLRQLRALAAERRALLVLMPDLSGLEAGRIDACVNTAQVPVQAILGALAR
jgi:hypothetical protein